MKDPLQQFYRNIALGMRHLFNQALYFTSLAEITGFLRWITRVFNL